MPADLNAATGLDALTHGIEAFVSLARGPRAGGRRGAPPRRRGRRAEGARRPRRDRGRHPAAGQLTLGDACLTTNPWPASAAQVAELFHYVPEHRTSAERLRRVIAALERISAALMRTTEGSEALVRAVVEAAAEHLSADGSCSP